MTALEVIAAIRLALAPYVFRVRTESQMQDQVTLALAQAQLSWRISREVKSRAGRYDLLVVIPAGPRVVLELKLHSAASPVERQAQRYAKMPDVDAVVVVTTSRRLAGGLGDIAELGGKPFAVFAVRTT